MFYTNRDNDDYLYFSSFEIFIFLVKNNPKNIQMELEKILSTKMQYEREFKSNVNYINIHKNSLLGKYLINSTPNGFLNNDIYIDKFKVRNALMISMYEDCSISKEILQIFKNQDFGTKEQLLEKYNDYVLDYILENSDFDYYLELKNGTYKPSEHFVYENGKFYKKLLVNKNKQLKKLNINNK